MPRASRFLIAAVLGFALALMLPIYPLKDEIRSFVVGGGGDQITHRWSLHTLFGLLGELRYQSSPTLPLVSSIGLFVILASALSYLAAALLKHIFNARS
jgi:hypothetical protein